MCMHPSTSRALWTSNQLKYKDRSLEAFGQPNHKANVRPSLLFSDDEDGLGAQNVRRCIQVAENDAALPASEKSKSSKKKAARGLIVCVYEFRMMVTKAQAEANRALIGIFSV